MYNSTFYLFSNGNIFSYKSSLSIGRFYSTDPLKPLIVSSNDAEASPIKNKFFEWFTGLACCLKKKGEGLFLRSIVNKGTSCSRLRLFFPLSLHFNKLKRNGKNFKFEIGVHKDDINMLCFIQQELGIGRVATFSNAAYFTVTAKDEIILLLKIFALHPLKSNKAWNYLNFKQAFELYINNKGKITEVLEEIKIFKSNMNYNRTDFYMSDYYLKNPISITPNWLLGFVIFLQRKNLFFISSGSFAHKTMEWDGTFFVSKRSGGLSYSLVFGLGQSMTNLYLMEAIRYYFNNLPCLSNGLIEGMQTQVRPDKDTPSFAYIYVEKRKDKTDGKQSDMIVLDITRTDYLSKVFIPLFDSMEWHSKKYLDFQDWKLIHFFFFVKKKMEKGLHSLPSGKELIDLILSQMNAKRLSNSKSKLVSREELLTKIEELLSLPSNYEIKEEGRIWVISENKYYRDKNSIAVILQNGDGNVIEKPFETLTACAQSLGETRNLITRYMLKGEPLLINNKPVYIKKSEGASFSESVTPTLESSVIYTRLWLSMGVNMTHILFNP